MNMKKWCAVLALGAALALLLALLGACSGQLGDSVESEEPQTGVVEPETMGDDQELAEINFWLLDVYSRGGDHGARIQQAINAITEPAIGASVNLTYMSLGEWKTKVQLSLAGGERIDLLTACQGSKVAQLYTRGMVLDITDYLTEYAPDALQLCGPYLDCFTYDGRIYGLPSYRDYVVNCVLLMRTDILQELGMEEQVQNLKTWEQLEELFEAVRQNYQNQGIYATATGLTLAGYLSHSGEISGYEVFDSLGDATGAVYTDMEGNVQNLFALPAYEEELQMSARWYENGWIHPEAPVWTDITEGMIKQGVAFSCVSGCKKGMEVPKSASLGYPLTALITAPGKIVSSNVSSWGCAVPATCEEPEAACQLINMLFTDETLMNLLTYGEEGVDYTVDDGVHVSPKPEQYTAADYLIGNYSLLKPLDGNPADYYSSISKTLEQAPQNPYFGFALDTTQLETEIGSISAVVEQYRQTLTRGAYTQELYQEFLQKLEMAGVQSYLDAIQLQLDAWMK